MGWVGTRGGLVALTAKKRMPFNSFVHLMVWSHLSVLASVFAAYERIPKRYHTPNSTKNTLNVSHAYVEHAEYVPTVLKMYVLLMHDVL